MNKESLDLNNLKKHSKLVEPWWSFLLLVIIIVLVFIATIFTIVGVIEYLTTLQISWIAVAATFLVGDVGSTLQLFTFLKNSLKNKEQGKMESLKFYKEYKDFFEKYEFDIKILYFVNADKNPNIQQKINFTQYCNLYCKALTMNENFKTIKIKETKKRLYMIFDILDEILSVFQEGNLNFILLIKRFEPNLSYFLLAAHKVYILARNVDKNIKKKYPFLDKTYEICYHNEEGGKSHVQEN